MAINVTMPKWGLTMKEGKISKWYKNEGDSVQKGEDLYEVETEKITNKVESPGSGILFQIVVPVGTKVPVGAILAVIAEEGETPERIEGIQVGEVVEETAGSKPEPSETERPTEKKTLFSSPAARRLAKELGIDLDQCLILLPDDGLPDWKIGFSFPLVFQFQTVPVLIPQSPRPLHRPGCPQFVQASRLPPL